MNTAPHIPRAGLAPARLFAQGSFAIMVGGWLAFLAALIVSPQTLDGAWTAARHLPLAVHGAVWLLGFPLLVGLTMWRASWHEPVRLLAIALLAVAYSYMFIPRKRR